MEPLEVLVDRHRHELRVHCYRMLGSYFDADDAVQETFVRAWRARDSFDGGPGVRAWLYRIATNVCLDAIRASDRRVRRASSFAEVTWLSPYPDRELDLAAPAADEPDAVVVARETVELAYVAVMQALPARQRAVLVLRDVVGWPAAQTADALGISVASANSALQRARATLATDLPDREQAARSAALPEVENDIVARYIAAHESGDARETLAVIHDDIRVTMPPYPRRYDGRDAVLELFVSGTGPNGPGQWLVRRADTNRMPAVACYLRESGVGIARIFKFDVLRIVDGRIAEITTFGPDLAEQFGVPASLG